MCARGWILCAVMATAAVAALALLPAVAEGSSGISPAASLARLVIGLAVVIGVLLVVARLLPRLNGATLAGGESFRVVAALPVGQRERVLVLQVGDTQVLIGVAAGNVRLLQTLDRPLALRDSRTGGGAETRNAHWLRRVLAGGR